MNNTRKWDLLAAGCFFVSGIIFFIKKDIAMGGTFTFIGISHLVINVLWRRSK